MSSLIHPSSFRLHPSLRRGFTFIESMVAVMITAMAGSAILLGVSSALQSTTSAMEQTIALGMAQQLMDELAGKRYAENPTNPYDTPLGPTASEAAGPGRSQFNNIGDYNGYSAMPPLDPWGVRLGADDGQGGQRNANMQAVGYLANWQRTAEVYYVDPANLSNRLSGGQTSNYRGVEVHVSIQDKNGALRPVLTLRRVFAYVPNS
jgi:prepilin-type N-terminal cleavage/methylation domain-containing protein